MAMINYENNDKDNNDQLMSSHVTPDVHSSVDHYYY